MSEGALLYGRGTAFPPRMGADGRMTWSTGEQNVRESIRIILATEPSERLMLPTFGAGLRRYLFEQNTVETRRLIEEDIRTALERWEPRISLRGVNVSEDPEDLRSAVATVEYRLIATQRMEQLSLSVRVEG